LLEDFNLSDIEAVVKEFIERSERNEIEFLKINDEEKISLEEMTSKYIWAIQKFGNKNKIARKHERSLYDLISTLRINGRIKYKI
jgi:hypothetical protein